MMTKWALTKAGDIIPRKVDIHAAAAAADADEDDE